MKFNIVKNISLMSLVALGFFGCAENNFDALPDTCVETSWVKNKEVSDIVTFANTTSTTYPQISTPKPYTQNDYIEGYVTSSDERGNFYKSVSLQTITTSGTPIGFSIAIDKESLYADRFTPGTKVTISLNGLYCAIVDGSLKIGELFEGTSIGRISVNNLSKFVFASCSNKVDENTFVRTLPISTAINNANLNTLIELDNVQFADSSLNRTMYDVDSGGGATNHLLMDKTTGVTTIIRNSSFAQFAGNKIPSGSGKIRGVLTKFGTTFQFLIRDFDDLKLNTPRFYNFAGTLNENFNSYTNNSTAFPKYLNLPILGTKSWIAKTASGLQYIEMSSFGGNIEKNRSLFMVPVDFTAANSMTFQIRAQFYNGACLKVYYTNNYTPGQNINAATLYDITSSFTIPTATTSSFASAGTYNIPASVTGNGFFVFEYVGSSLTSAPIVTTTMQIDNLVIN
ncbi:MAG: DUF5689 domain-containing protein [Limnohabitans sp.]|nr:DUF5689 domain-containing protein [Limnohabitans sp.]